MAHKKGVLLMAYGSPNKIEDIEPYYTDIRRGNKPTTELLAELTGRYQTIGGSSPLLKVTNAQAAGLQEELGDGYTVYIGMRHWTPWIKDAVAQMQKDGITQATGMVLAPHYSTMSIAKYIGKVEHAMKELDYQLDIKFVQNWHNDPLFIEALSEKLKEGLKSFSNDEQQELKVIFTAHSLPEKILLKQDPYKDQLLETSELVANSAGISNWQFAFQSAGRTQEKWLGPDLLEVLEELANAGQKAVLVCSVGFITDHLEVLYDIDIEGKQKATEKGMHLERAASLNDDPLLAKLLAEKVKLLMA